MKFRSSAENLATALTRLPGEDALALPFLGHIERRKLSAVADTLPFRIARPVIGPPQRAVHQDFELCHDVPHDNHLWQLAADLGDRLLAAVGKIDGRKVRFNDLIVQRYPPNCRGISPHRDHVCYRIVVAIVILSGDGQFCVCEDRGGNGAREIEAKPGEVLLMRAPGLGHRTERPFHFMSGVTKLRRTIGLRFDTRKP